MKFEDMKTERGFIVAMHNYTKRIVVISLEMWDLIENRNDYEPLYRADNRKDADNYVKEISSNIQNDSNTENKQEFINKACEVLESMLYMRDCGDYDCVTTAHDTVEEFINEFKKMMD